MRYSLEYYPNPRYLSIITDKIITTGLIHSFEKEMDKNEHAPLIKELLMTVPGITRISLNRNEVLLEGPTDTDNVFSWEEIIDKILAILKKHLDPGS